LLCSVLNCLKRQNLSNSFPCWRLRWSVAAAAAARRLLALARSAVEVVLQVWLIEHLLLLLPVSQLLNLPVHLDLGEQPSLVVNAVRIGTVKDAVSNHE
jgi:hypothetical protein